MKPQIPVRTPDGMERVLTDAYVTNYIETVDNDERNNFSDDVGIVVIGHMTHINELMTFYKGIKNVVFVLNEWVDDADVVRLTDAGFTIVRSNVAAAGGPGQGNINTQCVSSRAGAEYLNSIDRKYMIRMRSDQIIVQLHTYIQNMKFDKVSFFAQVNRGADQLAAYHGAIRTIGTKLGKPVDEETLPTTSNYVMDYCIAGPVIELEKFFSYIDSPNPGTWAEHKMLIHYLLLKDIIVDNTLDFLNERFYFMLPVLRKHKIDFLMLKQNYTNWTVSLLHDSPGLYRF